LAVAKLLFCLLITVYQAVMEILWRNRVEMMNIRYYSASCHFEAIGREIPRAHQVKAAWLDKIDGQSPFYLLPMDKSKVGGISPSGRNDMPEQLPLGQISITQGQNLTPSLCPKIITQKKK
jgi:hypothetical protein